MSISPGKTIWIAIRMSNCGIASFVLRSAAIFCRREADLRSFPVLLTAGMSGRTHLLTASSGDFLGRSIHDGIRGREAILVVAWQVSLLLNKLSPPPQERSHEHPAGV